MHLDESITTAFETIREFTSFDSHSLVPRRRPHLGIQRLRLQGTRRPNRARCLRRRLGTANDALHLNGQQPKRWR